MAWGLRARALRLACFAAVASGLALWWPLFVGSSGLSRWLGGRHVPWMLSLGVGHFHPICGACLWHGGSYLTEIMFKLVIAAVPYFTRGTRSPRRLLGDLIILHEVNFLSRRNMRCWYAGA